MIMLLQVYQATEKMDNKFSDGHHNMVNEKSDEENAMPLFENKDSSSIKDDQEDGSKPD